MYGGIKREMVVHAVRGWVILSYKLLGSRIEKGVTENRKHRGRQFIICKKQKETERKKEGQADRKR